MKFHRYSSTQAKYAMVYVAVTTVVLLFLNLFTAKVSQELFYKSKQTSMIDKSLLISDEVAKLEVMNHTTISSLVGSPENLKVNRLLVTDQTGRVLYDSAGAAQGSYALLPEIYTAMDCQDVFTWSYRDGAMESRAATPIVYYDTVIGCVYMMEKDTAQGALIASLQSTVLQITLILELLLLTFSIIYALTFSRRMDRIMESMRIIQEGDYSHKVDLGGHDELTLLGNEFNDLTERLQTSEQKRARFVSDASHELKTPLASIKLLSDSILQNDMDIDTIREFVGDIGNEADRLNRMTQKLLTLTKLDGDSAAECEIVYMEPTIRRVIRMLSSQSRNNHVTFQVDAQEDCPILIQEDDLYQIIFNLLENAIKYNVPNGTVTVTLERCEDNALLTVRDSGVGIPKDAIDHIFERFYRVDKARSRQSGGSGLGLAIVRAIVQRNRGEISVESTVGKGTAFTVIFPTFDTEVDKE